MKHRVSPLLLAAAVLLSTVMAAAVRVGDTIPSNVELHYGFPPDKVNLAERIAGKRVILLGLPG